MATVGTLVVKIGADFSGFERSLGSVQARLQSAGRQMQSIGAGLTLGLTAPIVGIATAALNSAAGFEKSMNLMAAMSGATAGEMAGLQSQALELGQSTVFSAGEAAEAMLELSKAGMTVSQAGGAIPGVLDLAAAANIGLADAATITANTINTFGLEASAAAEVANVLAGAANASSADVADLALGMKMAGAVFASNGQSVEEMAASLAILANNGIAGSDAGTSLKVMLMRLAAPTDVAAAAMANLNLRMYDSTGAMLPFGDVVGQLEQGLANLTDEQRNAALTTIFGADAIRAATILAQQGADGFDAMRDAVSAEGSAALLAQANMRGLTGAIEYFKGAIDSLLISTAMPYLDTLAQMVRGAADLALRFQNLPPGMQRFAAVLTAVLAVGGPLLVLLGTMAVAIGALASPIGLVIAALVLLGAVAVANWGRLESAVRRIDAIVSPALTAMQVAIDGLRSGDLTFSEIGTGLLTELQKLPSRIQAWAGSVDWVGLVDSAGEVGTSWRVKIESWLGEALGQVQWESAVSTTGDWTAGLQRAVWGLLDGIAWEQGIAVGGAWVEGLRTSVAARIESGLADAAAGLQQLSATATPVANALQSSLGALIERAAGEAGAMLATMQANIAPIKDAVLGWFAALTWQDAAGAAQSSLAALGATVNGWRDRVLGLLTSWVEGVDWEGLSLDFSAFVNRIAEGIRGIDLSQIPFSEILTVVIGGPIARALGLMRWVTGSDAFAGLVTAVQSAIASIQWSEMLKSVGNLADAVVGQVTDAANLLIQGYIDKLTSVDWTQLSLDFAGLLARVSEQISAIDWQAVGIAIGSHLRALFVGNEQGEGGLANLAVAVYDAIVAIDWYAVLTSTGELVVSLGSAILQVVSSAIATLFGATLDEGGVWTTPQWVLDLQVWLDGVLQTPAWVTSIETWWTQVTSPPAWVATLVGWWAAVTETPGWISSMLGWQDWLSGFSWPSIARPDWLSALESLWNSRPWWLGGGEKEDTANTGNNAVGTPRWTGGWTTVGEFGPELVRLPAGSQIYDHQASSEMAAGGPTIHLGGVTIHSGMDMAEFEWRLKQLLATRAR